MRAIVGADTELLTVTVTPDETAEFHGESLATATSV